MISDYFRLKALEKNKKIRSIRTFEEREAINFVKKNIDPIVKRYATLNCLTNRQSADILTDALITRYFPKIEEEIYDMMENDILMFKNKGGLL